MGREYGPRIESTDDGPAMTRISISTANATAIAFASIAVAMANPAKPSASASNETANKAVAQVNILTSCATNQLADSKS